MLRQVLGSQLWRAVTSPTSLVSGALKQGPSSIPTLTADVATPPVRQLLSLVRWRTNVALDPALHKYKPTTPGFRHRVITHRKDLWPGKPFKPLTAPLKSKAGRNHSGRITARHRGGGHKRRYRIIDFQRQPHAQGLGGVVERLEYDPNRTARIALVKYQPQQGSPEYRYVIAPQQVQAGHTIQSGPDAPVAAGNTLPLMNIPIGLAIHNIEKHPGKGGQLVRAAGTSATVMARDDRYVTIRLPSGEQRKILGRCVATIGAVSNPQHKNEKLGKAGANRWRGKRPHVRGVAMNPVDHPHGGGRGKSKGRISQSPTGIPAKGFKTRKKMPPWANHVVMSRHEAKRRSQRKK